MNLEAENENVPPVERDIGIERDHVGCRQASRRARCVLFVLTDADYPTAALEQAALLAHAIEGTLSVLRVLSESRPFALRWPDLDVVEATRRIQSCLAATRHTKSWCDRTLWEPLPVRQLRIRVGHFVEEVARRSGELDAALIVLPPSTARLGATATALAGASSRPVLVTRTFAPLAPLLAASDLVDEDFWVLQKAIELGAQLGAPVVAVHNVSAPGALFGSARSFLATALPHYGAIGGPQSRLAIAAERLRRPMEAVLANEADPVDAILQQARAHHATIVVGTRSSSRLEGLSEGSIAAQVVDRSDRSVVVTPRTSTKADPESMSVDAP